MHTITIAIRSDEALKTLRKLEEKHFITIVDKDEFDSPALPGKELSLSMFKKWINNAEQDTTVSLEEAKSIWARKRKQIEQVIK